MINKGRSRSVWGLACLLGLFEAADWPGQTMAGAGANADFGTRFNGELHGQAPPPPDPLTLWYRQPAGQWVEALAVGNGRLGAMVFGGIDRERIQLNEGTLWAGGP